MHAGADTIAAIATARGQAALAIVRVSGPQARTIASGCFRGADLAAVPSHTAHVGYVEGGGHTLDQVVATVFRAPRSATGEDVVELTCHGGDFASRLVLDALMAQGARAAAPGEFTQRAFLNGKLDLAQAEAVADLIHASSRRAHRVSLSQIRGQYSQRLAALREELLHVTALVELELDFAEEDVAFAERSEVTNLLTRAAALLGELLGSYRFGRFVREGVHVVIAGRPNAGKSTLLNRLVGYDRAIVSPVPGTTRDEIEAEGVERAHARLAEAEMVVYVYDVAEGLLAREVELIQQMRAERPDVPVFLVANKSDLPHAAPPPDHLLVAAARAEEGGVERLVALLLEATEAESHAEGSPIVTNQRHRAHLARATEAVARASEGMKGGVTGDVLAVDLKMALHELGSITGAITNEDVLDQIFSRFCIGK